MSTTETDHARTGSTSAKLAVGYAVASYVAFLAVFLYGVAFLADVVVPRTVDSGGPRSDTLTAVVVDSLLLGVFAVQHTVMARPAFKQRWTRVIPTHVERATFVLAASAALALVSWQWRPIPHIVWDVHAPVARGLLWGLFALGWVWALAMSYAIDHFDLFGLRQVMDRLRGVGDRPSSFRLPLPYRLVRHPMMLGFILAFLAAPRMTVGHLLYAGLGIVYILVGVRFEEHDLRDELPEYASYAATTPSLVPRLRRPARNSRRVGTNA